MRKWTTTRDMAERLCPPDADLRTIENMRMKILMRIRRGTLEAHLVDAEGLGRPRASGKIFVIPDTPEVEEYLRPAPSMREQAAALGIAGKLEEKPDDAG